MLVKNYFLFTLALLIRIRREEEGGGRGGERRWALACAVHQVKQILCKCSVVFLGGEFLWRGALGATAVTLFPELALSVLNWFENR